MKVLNHVQNKALTWRFSSSVTLKSEMKVPKRRTASENTSSNWAQTPLQGCAQTSLPTTHPTSVLFPTPLRAPQFLSGWLGKTERKSRLVGFSLEESHEFSGSVSSPRIQSSRTEYLSGRDQEVHERTEHLSGRDQEVHERRAAPSCRLAVFFVMGSSLCPLHPFE